MINMTELDNNTYNLSSLTQRIFSQYYLKPFTPTPGFKPAEADPNHFEITDSRIPRVIHGAMHASRVTAYVKIIHLFRQDQSDPAIHELFEFTQAFHVSLVQLIHLTQIAALFHDVARENEGIDHWDEASAKACLNFLNTEITSLPDCITQLIANTISYKDNKTGFFDAAISLGFTHQFAIAADYLRQLVHDADCLDVMRVRKTFKMQFLDMVTSSGLNHAFDNISALVKEIRTLIHFQGDQLFDCVIKMQNDTLAAEKANFNLDLKSDYEWVTNVYQKITNDMKSHLNLSRIERPLQELKSAYYPFNSRLLEAIKHAFMSASIVPEHVEASRPERRDYLFIKFQNPVVTSFTNSALPGDPSVVSIIFSGDAKLSQRCNQTVECLGGLVELGFRWSGTHNGTKGVEITGLSLKIVYPDDKLNLRDTLFHMICRELENANLITSQISYKERLLPMLSLPAEQTLNSIGFFKPMRRITFDAHQINNVKAYISEHIPAVPALYIRENELSINPAYQNTDAIVRSLDIGQKKIWLLRSDFILAVGNKNSNWTNFKDTQLSAAIETDLHAHINWEDRYGHPSLATPHSGYDGAVYYGGYLAQRNDCIEIYTFSGRYHRHDLDARHKAIMEAYIAYHFQIAYGNQCVVFIDAVAVSSTVLDNFELSIFMSKNPLPDYCIRRPYDSERILSIFNDINNVSATEANANNDPF